MGLAVVVVVWLGITVLIVVSSLRRAPPPPDAIAGAYTQRFPAIRLVIAVALAFAAFPISAVRARLVDTPVLELVGARPGRALYRGTVRATVPVTSPLTSSRSAWFQTRGGTRKQPLITTRSGGQIALTDTTGSLEIDPEMFVHGPNRRVVFQRKKGTLHEERVLLDGDLVTVYADCRIAEDGQLILTEARWAPTRSFQRNGVVGDGRRALLLLRVSSTVLLLAAWLMWMSLWLVQTWETDSAKKLSAMVLPDDPLRTAVVVTICTLVFVSLIAAIVIANRLIVLRNQITYASAVIDTAAVQRHDLVTSLLGSVDGATRHERSTLAGVALVRSDVHARAEVIRVEANPALASNPVFQQLQEQLTLCEDRLAAARRFHNDAVTVARDRSGTFPNLLVRPLVFPHGVPPLLTFDLA